MFDWQDLQSEVDSLHLEIQRKEANLDFVNHEKGRLDDKLQLLQGNNEPKMEDTSRAIASLALQVGEDKNISSIFPHFPVVSLIFPQIFFFILVFQVDSSPTWEGPGYPTGTPHKNISRYMQEERECSYSFAFCII